MKQEQDFDLLCFHHFFMIRPRHQFCAPPTLQNHLKSVVQETSLGTLSQVSRRPKNRWPMMKRCVASVEMATAPIRTRFFFVRCATWPFIKSATECRIFQKGPGFVDAANIRRQKLYRVRYVPIKREHLSRYRRPTVAAGVMFHAKIQ